jgi:hypothetical protein
MVKENERFIYKYEDGEISVFEKNENGNTLVRKERAKVKSQKDFEMEIIYLTQKLQEDNSIIDY